MDLLYAKQYLGRKKINYKSFLNKLDEPLEIMNFIHFYSFTALSL